MTCIGHGGQECSQLHLGQMMDASWQAPTGRRTQDSWSLGAVFAQCRRKSLKRQSPTKRNTDSLVGSFGTSYITLQCIFSAEVQFGVTLGEGSNDGALLV
mmetsp:Transcript_76016/g.118800  ORF Transcript_76016/g.118800 Transcript_76016/m.118800 type:complete len:100 (+) Transcript_76016:1209-1508(+)